jgi:glyoxylase-like metal-dependent hydrolase (beta-lactamase superfamily II)
LRFGNWQIDLIETGHLKLDGGAMFGVVPKPLWTKNNPTDERNRIAMTMRSICLRMNDRVILVDTGVGHKESEKFQEIFGIDFSNCTLTDGLTRLGIENADVTDVILTHLHFDHAGGSVYGSGENLAVTFPNATHYVQREHWNWAMNPSDRDKASFLPHNYIPIQESGKLRLLDGEEEILRDLSLHVVNGHTFGQQLVRVHGNDRSLLFAGDLVPMSAHVPGPWIMGYDLQPLVTLHEKNTLLKEAAERNDILLFEHDPSVEAATVSITGKGFELGSFGSLEQLLMTEKSWP